MHLSRTPRTASWRRARRQAVVAAREPALRYQTQTRKRFRGSPVPLNRSRGASRFMGCTTEYAPTKANPSKDGDAKPRAYRPSGTTAAGPPKAPEWVGVAALVRCGRGLCVTPSPSLRSDHMARLTDRVSGPTPDPRVALVERLRSSIRLIRAQPARVTLPQPLTLTPVTLDIRTLRATSERTDIA